MDYVVGIDGGGTKTIAVLADMQGLIVARSTGGPSNPNVVSKKSLINTFKMLLQDLEQQAPVQYKNLRSLFAGIAGTGNAENQKDIEQIIKQLLTEDVELQVVPDSINALYSGTYGDPGIVQISGTGSITYGINGKRKHCRVGGWGYLFGDEGSGYDIGRQGIISVLKSVDGRGPKTKMLKMMLSHFNVDNVYGLIQNIYNSPMPKEEISPLSKIVFQAYKLNDSAANDILYNVVEELVLNIQTLYSKLFETDELVKVVLCGGIFNEREIVPKLIDRKLQTYTSLKIVIPEIAPVCGSIIGAYIMNGIKPKKGLITNITNTYEKAGD
ncbi:N-acetylglucosamine kinase [Virgibacillus oceani]|uniref:N-acetylmuramic acid/N-acetylglucosamine kinase n=1 Tax=Virgibacillus oceani TaxID=1479511 RepID=A0A917H4Y3_9BACI|nr:BadF/BadG/BcrA/BcrD ATPase family protein [Virgibacillus oceani]GGG67778.1 N-acetylmuramic acid/N-acetylglucosamine kinase [Virgibacillus oceani]